MDEIIYATPDAYDKSIKEDYPSAPTPDEIDDILDDTDSHEERILEIVKLRGYISRDYLQHEGYPEDTSDSYVEALEQEGKLGRRQLSDKNDFDELKEFEEYFAELHGLN